MIFILKILQIVTFFIFLYFKIGLLNYFIIIFFKKEFIMMNLYDINLQNYNAEEYAKICNEIVNNVSWQLNNVIFEKLPKEKNREV